MSQPVASITSAPGQIDGNDNNSSLALQFLQLPASGNVTVNVENNPNSGSITFTLWHEKGKRQDQKVQDGCKNARPSRSPATWKWSPTTTLATLAKTHLYISFGRTVCAAISLSI